MYMPIWLLYWFPYALIVNLIIKTGLINIGLWIGKKYTRNAYIYCEKTAYIALGINFLAEFIGLALFYVFELNLSEELYYGNYTSFSAIIFLITIALMFFGNYKLNFRKIDITKKQKIAVAVTVSALSAPYLFLMPL